MHTPDQCTKVPAHLKKGSNGIKRRKKPLRLIMFSIQYKMSNIKECLKNKQGIV